MYQAWLTRDLIGSAGVEGGVEDGRRDLADAAADGRQEQATDDGLALLEAALRRARADALVERERLAGLDHLAVEELGHQLHVEDAVRRRGAEVGRDGRDPLADAERAGGAGRQRRRDRAERDGGGVGAAVSTAASIAWPVLAPSMPRPFLCLTTRAFAPSVFQCAFTAGREMSAGVLSRARCAAPTDAMSSAKRGAYPLDLQQRRQLLRRDLPDLVAAVGQRDRLGEQQLGVGRGALGRGRSGWRAW